MMSIPQAVDLVFKAILSSVGGELFILKMPVVRIEDLAKEMIKILAPQYGKRASDVKLVITGKRDGEKLYELLLTEEEVDDLYENADMLCIEKNPRSGFKRSSLTQYKSDMGKIMTSSEIQAFIHEQLGAQ